MKHIRTLCPKAKLYLHETWAYEDGSEKLANMGYESGKAMFADIEKAYQLCCETIGADGLIPCGKLMMTLLDKGIEKVHRDGAHVAMGVGRYLLSLCWLKALTGIDISGDTYMPIDAPITEDERAILIRAVNETAR